MSFKEIISVTLILFSVIDILGSLPVIIGLKEQGKKIEPANATIISGVLMIAFPLCRRSYSTTFRSRCSILCYCGGHHHFYPRDGNGTRYYPLQGCRGIKFSDRRPSGLPHDCRSGYADHNSQFESRISNCQYYRWHCPELILHLDSTSFFQFYSAKNRAGWL